MAKYEAGFIGAGSMGGALAQAAVKTAGGGRVAVACSTPEHSEKAAARLGCAAETAETILWESRFVFLGVKPQMIAGLVKKLAEEALGWKKSTTYTVLKRLCDRGIFQNEGGTVTSQLSRADYDTAQSQQFVEESFSGSLPAFITAFTRRKKLTEDEIAELQKLIDQNRR